MLATAAEESVNERDVFDGRLVAVVDLGYMRIGIVFPLVVFRHIKGFLARYITSSMRQVSGLQSWRRFMVHLPFQCPKRVSFQLTEHEYNSTGSQGDLASPKR